MEGQISTVTDELNGASVRDDPTEGFLKRITHNEEYRAKCLHTLCLLVLFWAFGFEDGMRGPVFLDLQIITNTDVEQASFFNSASAAGYMVGSLLVGVMYDRFHDKQLQMMLYASGMAVAIIILPWCSPYPLMIAIHFVRSVFSGGLDTTSNADIMRTWGKEGEPAMQSLYFAFSFGGVLAPMVTVPFLTPMPNTYDQEEMTIKGSATQLMVTLNKTFDLLSQIVSSIHSDEWRAQWMNSTSVHVEKALLDAPLANTSSEEWRNRTVGEWNNVTENMTQTNEPLTTNVHYAFLISGVIISLATVLLTVEWCRNKSKKRGQGSKDKSKQRVQRVLPLSLFISILTVLCIFHFAFCAVDDTFMRYLSTFVVKQLHWTKAKGAQLTSVLLAALTIVRFMSIFGVRFISSTKVLIVCCSLYTTSLLGLLLAGEHAAHTAVWVCTIGFGTASSCILPVSLMWMQEELIRATGRVTSAIFLASSLGSFINPIFLGYLMQELSPMWFTYILFGQSCVCLSIFFFLLGFSRFHIRKHKTCTMQDKDEINVDDSQKAEDLSLMMTTM